MLKRNKGEKIVILTTHYMDEADVVGDRIAIMSHGQAWAMAVMPTIRVATYNIDCRVCDLTCAACLERGRGATCLLWSH